MIKFTEKKANQVVILCISLMILSVWAFAGIGKLSGGLPVWFTDMYQNTFFARVPGLTPSYWVIILAELTGAVLAFVSIVRMEFLKTRLPFLRAALMTSVANFLMLCFGIQVASGDGQDRLFIYFSLSVLLYAFVDRHEKGHK